MAPSQVSLYCSVWVQLLASPSVKDDLAQILVANVTVGWKDIILGGLPVGLTELVLFEESDEAFHGPVPGSPEFGARLAESTVKFERLSLNTLLVTAQDFFSEYMVENHEDPSSLPHWPLMTELMLESEFVNLEQPAQAFTDLFLAAGRAALNMPRLEVLEIWFCRRDTDPCDTAIFRYQRSRKRPDGKLVDSVLTVTSSSPHPIFLHQRVIREWRVVAQRHAGRQLLVETGQLQELDEYCSTLDHLELRSLMLHPVSLLQIQAENRPHRSSGHVFFMPP